MPELGREDALNLARDLAIRGRVEMERCRRSALYYLERYCYTIDEHSKEEPVRRLIHGDPVVCPETLQLVRDLDGQPDDFLRYLAIVFQEEPLLAVPKSRQMRVSHLSMALHGWLPRFWSGQRIAIQSKTFEDADALLERLHQSWIKQRELHWWMPWPTWERKVGRLLCPNGSIVMAIAQGPDKLRSYTFSRIFSDEMGFQAQAEDAYTAAVPTIEGGGGYMAVSSANPGFFQSLVFDKAGSS